MPLSTIQPKEVEIKQNNNLANVVIRNNITSETTINELSNVQDILYKYDEYIAEVNYTECLLEEVKNNKDVFIELAKKQKEEKETLINKQNQMKELLDGGIFKQLDINDKYYSLLQSTNDNLLAFMDMYFSANPEQA